MRQEERRWLLCLSACMRTSPRCWVFGLAASRTGAAGTAIAAIAATPQPIAPHTLTQFFCGTPQLLPTSALNVTTGHPCQGVAAAVSQHAEVVPVRCAGKVGPAASRGGGLLPCRAPTTQDVTRTCGKQKQGVLGVLGAMYVRPCTYAPLGNCCAGASMARGRTTARRAPSSSSNMTRGRRRHARLPHYPAC